MTTFQPGERVKLALTRNNEVRDVMVALIETPGTKPPPQALEWELLPGLRVMLVNEKLRNQLLLPKDFQALRALSDFKTADGTLKVAAGDFILRVNGYGVTRSLEDSDEKYIERLRPKKPLVLLRLQQKSGAQTDIGFPLPAAK